MDYSLGGCKESATMSNVLELLTVTLFENRFYSPSHFPGKTSLNANCKLLLPGLVLEKKDEEE